MPVIINPETGAAESVAADAVELSNIPLYTPEGEAVSVPFSEAAALLQQGYSQPTPEENKAMLDQSKYSTPMEQAKAFGQGAVSGATLGMGTGILKAYGASEEGLQKRAAINPIAHGAGELTGLVGGALLSGPVSAAGAMEAGAAAGAKALGLGAETALGRVGSLAAKAGIENAIFEGGHEASKYFAGNPDSVETAAAHVGLAGLMGAGFGGVAGGGRELWKLGPGAKIAEALDKIKSRAAGAVDNAVEVPETLQAMMQGDNWATKTVQVMQESDTMAGRTLQEDMKRLYTNLNEGVAETVGKTSADIESLALRRESELGEVAKESLEKRIRAEYEPIQKKYDSLESRFGTVPIKEQLAPLEEKIANIAIEQGYLKAPDSAQAKLIARTLKELPLQETAADLGNYIKNMTYNAETWPAQKLIKQAFQEAKDGAIESNMALEGADALLVFRQAQQEYKAMKETISQLNDRLRTGKQRGAESFLKNVNESTPEDILHALSAKGDAQYQQLLQEKFPELAQMSKDQELVKLLKKAPGADGQIVNGKKLIKLINELPIENREFLIGADGLKRLNDIGEMFEKIPKSMNPSGTAKTIKALDSGAGATALGLAVGLMSQSGIAGFLAGMSKMGLKEGHDALRLAAMKFLGSAEKTSAEGFAAAAKLADATIKGEQKLNKVIGSVFSSSDTNVIEFPDAASRDKLKKQINESLSNPEKLMEAGGDSGHYLPQHGAAIGAMAVRNLGYLSTLRPNLDPLGPLDKMRVASSTEDAKYNRALDIAQQPLIIVDAIKRGELTISDMQHMKTMYPELSNRISEKLTAELVSHRSKGEELPYKTKLSLSVWAHQPLDSSMSQQSIMANQLTFMSMPAPQGMQGTPAKASAALNKIGASSMTLQQSRASSRAAGHR